MVEVVRKDGFYLILINGKEVIKFQTLYFVNKWLEKTGLEAVFVIN